MYLTKGNEQDLYKALEIVNQKFKGNVFISEINHERKGVKFRLKVKSNKGPGHSLGHMSRSKNHKYNHFVNKIREANSVSIEPEYIIKQSRLSFACWHVHGEFFDAVFEVNPNAVIYSMGKKITKEYGNWEDTCINSFQGIFKSSMCEC